eukprot:m51a1_g10722 hypothetical protein (299) ;mRNA; r:231010-231951
MRGFVALCAFSALAGLGYGEETDCKCGADAPTWSMPAYNSKDPPHLLAKQTCEAWQVAYVESFKFDQFNNAQSWICLGRNMTDLWNCASWWEWRSEPTDCVSWTGALHAGAVPKSAYPLGQIILLGNCRDPMPCYGRVLLNVTCLDPREWRTSAWSSCSSSCTRTRSTWCINNHTGATVADAECEGWGTRPAGQQACQSGACRGHGNCVCTCVNATGADEAEMSFDTADCGSGCTQAACQSRWPSHCPSTTTGSVGTQCTATEPANPSHPGSPSGGSSTRALPLGLLAALWVLLPFVY